PRPVVGLLDLDRPERRPQLDMAGLVLADRQMLDRFVVARQPVAIGLVAEDEVDGGQDVLGRAERALQPYRLEAPERIDHPRAEFAAAEREGLRLRTLERIDRLLLVAHREDRAG